MKLRKLHSPVTCYRIADSRHAVMSGIGAALVGGRWNSPGVEVIYGSLTYEGALLERLAHSNIGVIPPHHVCVEVRIPSGLIIQEFEPSDVYNWAFSEGGTRDFGDRWVRQAGSVALLVPGVVARPYQQNVVLNPHHPDYAKLKIGPEKPVVWDSRLFRAEPYLKPNRLK